MKRLDPTLDLVFKLLFTREPAPLCDMLESAPSAVIVWLTEPLLPTLVQRHAIFELRERHTHLLFGDQLAFHLLQLGALPTASATGYADRSSAGPASSSPVMTPSSTFSPRRIP